MNKKTCKIIKQISFLKDEKYRSLKKLFKKLNKFQKASFLEKAEAFIQTKSKK
jgi:hypothetical protein